MNKKQKYIVMWFDDNNSVARKGGVEYNGKRMFDSYEEAKKALEEDRDEEYECNPKTTITYRIFDVSGWTEILDTHKTL
jgi:hypothetical protein